MKSSFLSKENSFKYFIPILFVVLNFVLKIIYLDTQSIANDEPFSIFAAQMDISAIFSELTEGNNPPFFEIMLHFWIKIFGISPFSVRFLPFLFSVFTVLVIYKIGRSFFNNYIAVASSLIFTFSNYYLAFSHETRVYSFFCLLTCVSMLAFLKVSHNSSERKYWFLLIVSNFLLSYSHYFGLFVPIIQSICVLGIAELRMKLFKSYLKATIITCLFYVPMIPIVLTRFMDSSSGTWVQPSTIDDFYTMLWRFSNVPLSTVIFILVLLSAAVKWLFFDKSKMKLQSKVLLVWFLFPYLLMFLVSLKYWSKPLPVFMDRYVIFIAVAYYFCIAIGLDYLFKSFKIKLLVSLLPFIILVATFNANVDNKRHVIAVIDEIKEQQTKDVKLVICPEFYDLNIAYYLMPQDFIPDNGSFKEILLKKMALKGIFAIQKKEELSQIEIHNTKKLLYLDAGADFSSPQNGVFDSLNAFYGNYKLYEFPDIFKLYVFEK